MSTAKEKLHPKRFSGMSGKMAAIIGCIFNEKYTEPHLVELTVTSDGFVLGRQSGDCGMNEFIGHVRDLERNWRNLLDAAGLTDGEREEAEAAFASQVRRYDNA